MRFRTERDTAVGAKAKAKCVLEVNVDELAVIVGGVDRMAADVVEAGSLAIDLHGAQAAAVKLEADMRHSKGLGR